MKYQPNRLGTMIDCSRNAVASVESVKKWIDLTSSIGYNTLMLYTEDTYEVSGEPYFGYMRGRYSREELRGLDAYAKNKNMELIPCIQTLAHLNALNRWPEYKEHFDVDDILLNCVGALLGYAVFSRCLRDARRTQEKQDAPGAPGTVG